MIPEYELEYSFFRSSGPGGQKKNTTDSAVRLRHLPTGLVVVATASRSQHRNKAAALEVLEARLLDRRRRPTRRVATRPSRGVRRRRVEDKRRQGMKKASRRVRDDN